MAERKETYSVSGTRKAIQTDNSWETNDSGTSRKKQHEKPFPRSSLDAQHQKGKARLMENI